MKRLKTWLGLGRVLLLQVFLVALSVMSILYIIVNIVELSRVHADSGSLSAMIAAEWRGGRAVTELLGEGMFQLFLLIIGWSMYLRLRMRELGHLRLRRSEQKYRSIINHAGEAIFLLDAQGRILEWNKSAEDLFRQPRRNVLNRRLGELDLGLELDIDAIFADVQRARRSLSFEAQTGTAGAVRQLNMIFSCIWPGAGPLAEKEASFVVIARDITSEKQLESRMSETEKMAGIGQLAAGIAHQLNTPLGSILLSAQMLEDAVENEDDSEDIRRIIRQTEQCRGIIKGLLNFARPTGRERGRMDLADAVRETVYLMEKNLNVAGIDIAVDVTTDTAVYGNRNELEQVFFNLLANSMDAMPQGGRIDIGVEDGGAGEIRVTFADNGPGIARDTRDRIFLPFFTTKDYGKGTGLGLSIVARIVHEHGGRIELRENVQRGTVFDLWLPRAHRGSNHLALIDDETPADA
jgi:PAS domain S-box-containing protein